ncbi:uncharacterized protein LOC133185170 [Saccostrea echinata]|uniref:uncharacterized protein LOC133185170 n=1 Tax=Saccostrea echinata TaxID=191078 RepID=UPI002A7F6D27|nr:uncharacterized protein LOC133185170 [Saccostrea echinata]
MPFNPRIQTNRGPFKFRTFFKIPPSFIKTGSSPHGNNVIGIVKTNAKVYPIPIFPGAISGNIGEPVNRQTDSGLDIFNGNEFSAFLDPTTNLPVGFTVKKFDYEVGSVVDLLQNNKPRTVKEKKKVAVVSKENKREGSGVLKLLDNDAIVKKIVTVLRRKGPLKPNENELVIPPNIIDSKSRNNIILYLKDLKTRKHNSTPKIPLDLIKLLKNPVFVRYIKRTNPVTSNNTMNIPETNKVGLIFDRIGVSGEPIQKKKETLASESNSSPTTKSNTKVMTSKSKKAKAFLNTKQMPPIVPKSRARVIKKNEPVISLPPVPVLKFDSILDLKQRKPLKMNLTKEICRGCTLDGGLGYANHPSRCDRFVVCYPGEGGNLVPIEQECAYGLFWSQTALTCRLPKDVLCPYDKCRKSAEKRQYPHEGNCKAFWECRDGYSVPQCCPSGMAFREGKGCVKNVGFCKSRCPIGESEIQPVFWQGECDKRAVPGSPDKFERHVYFQSNPGVAGRIQQEWMVQQCSPGTEFRPEVCDCRASETLTNLLLGKRVCSPDVYLPFTHGLSDESIARTHVRADNVTMTTSGTACFSGQSVLAMARFANMDLGSYLYVKIRYRHVLSNPKNEVLLYNGDCERKPSLILGSTADGNFVSVLSTTGEMHTINVKSPIPAIEWRRVALVIDNGNIKLTSDSQTAEKNAVGVVERAQCGMKIGWGEGYEHFNGCIDDFTLYRCKPDRPIGS